MVRVLSTAVLFASLVLCEGVLAESKSQAQSPQPKSVDLTKNMNFKVRADAVAYIQSVCATYGQLKNKKDPSLDALSSEDSASIEKKCSNPNLHIPSGDGTVYLPLHAGDILGALNAACEKGLKLHRTTAGDDLEQVCKAGKK